MKECVKIKSFPKGISLHLSPEVEFEEIRSELAFKFGEAKNFFKSARMALSIEGREITSKQEEEIIATIQENSSVRIICIVGHDEGKNAYYTKAVQEMEQKLLVGDEGQFYKGSLRERDVLETENSIVILGDVLPGSAVISSGNIVVLGGLYGEAYAGGNGNENAFVVALEMAPERIKIGDFKYKNRKNKRKKKFLKKVQPKMAVVKKQKIVFEPLTKDLLESF